MSGPARLDSARGRAWRQRLLLGLTGATTTCADGSRRCAGPGTAVCVLYGISVALVAVGYYLAGRIGLELAYLDGAVAALWPPAGFGLAVLFSVWRSALAGHCDRRSLARGLLDAARNRLRPDGGEHAGARGRGPGIAPPDRRARRARTRIRRAGPRRVRVRRRHHQRCLRADVAVPRRRDPRRRTRARLSHLDTGRRSRRPGPCARHPDLVRVRVERDPTAGPR